MSATLNSLKKVQEEREGIYSSVINKQNNGNTDQVQISNNSALQLTPPKNKTSWILILSIAILIIILLTSNLLFAMALKNSSSEKVNMLSKLNKLESVLNEETRKLKILSDTMNKLGDNLTRTNFVLKGTSAKIKQLEENKETQDFAIDILKKTKNTLLSRLNKLEEEITKEKDLVALSSTKERQ